MTKKEDLLILFNNYRQRLITLMEFYKKEPQRNFEDVRNNFKMIEDEILPDLKQLLGEGHKYYQTIRSNLHPLFSSISFDRKGQIVDLSRKIVGIYETIERVMNLVEKDKYPLKKIKKTKEHTPKEKEEEITKVIMILDIIFGAVIISGFLSGIIVVFSDPIQSIIPFFIGSLVGFVLWV